MDFVVSSEDGSAEIKDIARCLRNILSIPSGSVPLARDLGISWANLSQIPPDLENEIAVEIVEKVEKYEPRVSVNEVSFSYAEDGRATVHISIEWGEEAAWET